MARLTGNKNRINTCTPNLMVYRITRQELSTSVFSLQGGNTSQDTTAYMRFTMNGTGSDEWTKFVNWWKRNTNLIILGCMVYNIQDGHPNRGRYWCPTNRCPNPTRTDNYTNYLEFLITRNDAGIFDSNTNSIYEFYFINLSH